MSDYAYSWQIGLLGFLSLGFIVSTSTSRKSNEGLYLAAWWNAGQNSESVLRGWKFDYNNQDNRMAWWLWPAGGEADLFYLVATRDSRRPGQMVYLDIFGVPRLWPFHPDTSDPMAEWKLVPADLASGVVKSEDDMPAYFIVSGSNQRYKNEMLFVRGRVGPIDTWKEDLNDDKATWKLIAAPISELPDWDAAKRVIYQPPPPPLPSFLRLSLRLCLCVLTLPAPISPEPHVDVYRPSFNPETPSTRRIMMELWWELRCRQS